MIAALRYHIDLTYPTTITTMVVYFTYREYYAERNLRYLVIGSVNFVVQDCLPRAVAIIHKTATYLAST